MGREAKLKLARQAEKPDVIVLEPADYWRLKATALEFDRATQQARELVAQAAHVRSLVLTELGLTYGFKPDQNFTLDDAARSLTVVKA